MTYKERLIQKNSAWKIKEEIALRPVPDDVIKQYFFEAILKFEGNLDALGRGIYIYWDETGRVIDVAGVPMDGIELRAPYSSILEELEIPHGVACYRCGGDRLGEWAVVEDIMKDLVENIWEWTSSFIYQVFSLPMRN